MRQSRSRRQTWLSEFCFQFCSQHASHFYLLLPRQLGSNGATTSSAAAAAEEETGRPDRVGRAKRNHTMHSPNRGRKGKIGDETRINTDNDTHVALCGFTTPGPARRGQRGGRVGSQPAHLLPANR